MPHCHQCNADLANGRRTCTRCSICRSPAVEMCFRCAMWEEGPLPGTQHAVADEVAQGVQDVYVPRQSSSKFKRFLASIGPAPVPCELLLKYMGEVSPYVADQLKNKRAKLYGKQFAKHACTIQRTFDRLYPTCKYSPTAIKILLVAHLSAQERVQCRVRGDSAETSDAAVEPVKRWQIRLIASTLLGHHRNDIAAAFGQQIEQELFVTHPYLEALAWDDLEYFLKGFKSPTLTAIDLLAHAGGWQRAREILEIATILYHVRLAARPQSAWAGHWSASASGFLPGEALGYVSAAHFTALFGNVEVADGFCDAAQYELDRLWTVLHDPGRAANQLPQHPRFPDQNVQNENLLDAVEKRYLQYLPTFDHLRAQKAQRSACETVVRRRVVHKLTALLHAHPTPDRPNPDPEPDEPEDPPDSGCSRRDVSRFVDKVLVAMQHDFLIDQCFDTGLTKHLIDEAAQNRAVEPKGFFPLSLQAIDWDEVFPADGFAQGHSFLGLRRHYAAIDGTSARPAHYLDWRNHKDRWLYDCFPIDPQRRPLFASLAVHPIVPEPNNNYGHHFLLYDSAQVRHRRIICFGDKQQPRRSMLLLLDDLLYGHTKKDGDGPQAASSRLKVLERVLRRVCWLHSDEHDDIEDDLEEQLERSCTGTKLDYPEGDFLFECQIFGGVDLVRDATALVVKVCADVDTGQDPVSDPGHMIFTPALHFPLSKWNAAKLALAQVYPQLEVLAYKAVPWEYGAQGGRVTGAAKRDKWGFRILHPDAAADLTDLP
ncbi:hypothetical protein [Nannocystis pusilla]|uniref:Uncharacterized protein n=1 Tax=Nannocystis pusilla TaxID=889268 RepID=A0ABS7TXH5_9BACT|nr:hypothetical protein [Nannocystis pusilla]MBZ5712964.1 hypothetical protein [Nannocystis pusilla]